MMSDTAAQSGPEGPFRRAESKTSEEMALDTIKSKIAAKTAAMPAKYRRLYVRAMTGRSLRAAVNAFCLECVAYQRDEVRHCTAATCPLFAHRPYKR